MEVLFRIRYQLPPMRLGFLFPFVALLCVQAPASAQIYKCENADGVIEYSNAPPNAQSGRTCEAIQLAPITSIPAPKLPPQKAVAPPAESRSAARPAASASFPRVDSSTQRARDSDRRRILEDERAKEEARLAELRKEYNDGEPERVGGERNYQKYLDRVQRLKEDIARSEANLASIRQELAGVRP